MIYLLRGTDGTILGAGERDDWVPVDGQTVEALGTTLAAYARRFHLSADRTRIAADGADAALVTVRVEGSPPPAEVVLKVNGTPQPVVLAGGAGSLLLQAETPGVFVVEPADPAQYCRAGEGTLVITAEEAV